MSREAREERQEELRELALTLHNFTIASEFAEDWRADTIVLNGNTSAHLASANRQRRRCLVWTDSGNQAAVYISSKQVLSTGARSGAIALAPDSESVEFKHSGHIYAYSQTAGTIVYVVEEYHR